MSLRFAVFLDVDGVLKHGYNSLPGAKESIEKLVKNNVSFRIITNAGGELESERALKLNQILKLDSKSEIKGEQVMLCHTAFKNLLPTHKNKFILGLGIGDIPKILSSYGFNKFMTVEEYCQIYRQSVSYFLRYESLEECKATIDKVEKRLNHKFENDVHSGNGGLSNFLKFDSIFVMTDVSGWERNVQVMSDILISKDGIPGTIRRSDENQHVDLHISAKDMEYKDSFALNRIGCGGFVHTFETLFHSIYKRDVEYQLYGKPSKTVFEYAINTVREEHPCDRFYMIGDNPEVDILGAHNANIQSVLLQTGVWQKKHNSPTHPGTYFTHGVKDAIDLILKVENI